MSLKVRSMPIPVLISITVPALMRSYAGTTRILCDDKGPWSPCASYESGTLPTARDNAWMLKDQARQILSGWPIQDALFCCEYGLSCHCFVDYSRNRPISIAAVTTIDFGVCFRATIPVAPIRLVC